MTSLNENDTTIRDVLDNLSNVPRRGSLTNRLALQMIQRRMTGGGLGFNVGWAAYQGGFGTLDVAGEFWLGKFSILLSYLNTEKM